MRVREARPSRAGHERARHERGSALILVPAAVLILLALAAMALDSAAVFLGQRELAAAVASAATDAATSLDEGTFYATGAVELSPADAARVASHSLMHQSLDGARLLSVPDVEVAGRQVCVRAAALVKPVIGSGLPFLKRGVVVSATATATAAGDTGPAVPARTICR